MSETAYMVVDANLYNAFPGTRGVVQAPDPDSLRGTWAANTVYEKGDCVIPSSPNGHTYIATALPLDPLAQPPTPGPDAGQSGDTEPDWPIGGGATLGVGAVIDGSLYSGDRYLKWNDSLALLFEIGSTVVASEIGFLWPDTTDWWFEQTGGLGTPPPESWPGWDYGQRFLQVSYELEDVINPLPPGLPGEIFVTRLVVVEEITP